jgi:putative SOS response-associated peptidase YedK
MCGRFALSTPDHILAELFQLLRMPSLQPRYNIAPAQPVAVVRSVPEGSGREMTVCRWGLVPSWAKDPAIGARMINARAEGVAEKPSFRGPLRSKRCLIPADGFYEWAKAGTRKQPHFITMKDGSPFAFAGLWDAWAAPDGSALETCAIVTTAPNEVVAPIHDRMPAILERKDYGRWLSRDALVAELLTLLRPYPAGAMKAYPVGLDVNTPRNDGPSCRAPRPDVGGGR